MCSDVFDKKTGEIFISKDQEFTEDLLKKVKKTDVRKIRFLKSEGTGENSVIANTIQKDTSRSDEEALNAIYQQLRSGEAPDLETARNLLERLFFNEKRYDLGDVGRYRMNAKLSLSVPGTVTTLTKEDIIAIINYLLDLQEGRKTVDDIDHLGNRRVRTVGEQIGQQFNIGLARWRGPSANASDRDQKGDAAGPVNARPSRASSTPSSGRTSSPSSWTRPTPWRKSRTSGECPPLDRAA